MGNLLKIKKKKFYLMKKSNGKLNYNIAIFISGRGSNLKSIIKKSLKKKNSLQSTNSYFK